MSLRALLLALLCCIAGVASAHEVRPAYLELRQTAAETYDVLWKVPARGDDLRFGLYVELPPDCSNLTEPRGEFISASFIERWSVRRAGGLDGATIKIAGLAATKTDVLVRVERLDGTTQVQRLMPAAPSFVVAAAPSAAAVAFTYLKLGVEHILLGIDHLLFVLALLILVQGTHRLVVTITAFTVAHSITLAGASLGLLSVAGAPVEACIALSIVFIAAEIVHDRNGQPGLTARRPWIVAFAFGLLHGFGFAGALHEIGLPQTDIPLALLFFNIGVEVGQLLFIAAALAIVFAAATFARRISYVPPAWAWRLPPYAIGAVASFWLIERLVILAA
jgi:hydrogenase/urease accessory protein HupE